MPVITGSLYGDWPLCPAPACISCGHWRRGSFSAEPAEADGWLSITLLGQHSLFWPIYQDSQTCKSRLWVYRVPSFSTTGIVDQTTLYGGGCSVHYRMFSGIPGLYPRETNKISLRVVTTKNVFRYYEMPPTPHLQGRTPLAGTHQVRTWEKFKAFGGANGIGVFTMDI